jgi:multidrug efflux pump subunit AcrB
MLMLFTALFIIGFIAWFSVPTSLLPDIAIPEITVRISGRNVSARELENTTVAPVRQQLQQVNRLRAIRSETRDGSATIRLSFEYGVNTDLAFIEVNEKIDAAMSVFPKEIERPRVIKASATDIPVLNLYMTLGSTGHADSSNAVARFVELSDFAESVIRRRIEQLPQVAMADMSGMVNPQLAIIPDQNLLDAGNFTLADIEAALTANNYNPGSMLIRDGYYEYNIRFATLLRSADDARNIRFSKNGRIYRLGDIARIEQTPEKEKGMAIYNGKRAVAIAVIKQSEENMANMQAALNGIIANFRSDYPDIEFNITQNQTELLDYTISNLKQNLFLAFIFVCIVSFMFLNDLKSPVIIGISMVVSLVVSLLLFYLCHISLNVVSLTGLILALGMMIDNSIIVTDNIGQHRMMGRPLEEACVSGTGEVVAPMLSSTLTTVSIFVPLIFLSGIAGAIFFDQAFSVTAGLLVSYITGIALLPVLYRLVYSMQTPRIVRRREMTEEQLRSSLIFRLYDGGIEWVFRHKTLTAIAMIAVFPLCFLLFKYIPKEKIPDLHQHEMTVALDWNENINVAENYARSVAMMQAFAGEVVEMSAFVGQQQFMLGNEREQSASETQMYVCARAHEDIDRLKAAMQKYVAPRFPAAIISFAPTGTVFEKIFSTGEPEFVAEYHGLNRNTALDEPAVRTIEERLTEITGQAPEKTAFQAQLNISFNREKLLLYGIPASTVERALKTAFRENRFSTLHSEQQYLPVTLGGDAMTVNEVMRHTLIDAPVGADGNRRKLPLAAFIEITPGSDLKTITAGKSGEYIPFVFTGLDAPDTVMSPIAADARSRQADISFSGSWFSNRRMLGELAAILFISLLLMYFILTAQFENFVQPLIVLAEIPIDITAALALLLVCGHTLNLMSAIGIIVACGVIINDSILKVDVMNQLRKSGMSLMEVIHEAGRRRLKAILMTALTSVVCMAPLFFSSDLGSELEKPLALATIGGMVVGTPISLFVVPLLYWWTYRKKSKNM